MYDPSVKRACLELGRRMLADSGQSVSAVARSVASANELRPETVREWFKAAGFAAAAQLSCQCGGPLPELRHPGQARKWCSESCRVRHVQPYKPRGRQQPSPRDCRYCGAAYSGLGRAFRCGECRSANITGPRQPCSLCEREFWPRTYGQRYCSLSCSAVDQVYAVRVADPAALKGKTHQQRARRFGGDVERVDRYKVFERDGWLCMICLMPVDRDAVWPDPKSVSLDHIVPLSRGGGHTYRNVQCAHLACNIAKGASYGGASAVA